MSTHSLAELADNIRAKRRKPRVCKRCGKPFTPYQQSKRVYCFRTECEDARMATQRNKLKLYLKLKRERRKRERA